MLGLAWLGFCFYSFEFPSSCLALRISMGPSRSSALRIGGSSTEASSSGQTGDEPGRLAVVVRRVTSRGPPSPLGKDKGKGSEI